MTVTEWVSEGKNYYAGVMLLRSRGLDTKYFDRYMDAPVPPQYQALRLADEIFKLSDEAIAKQNFPKVSNFR